MNSETNDQELTLKGLRESLDLSQEGLGRRLSLSYRTIAEWESGRKVPRLDNAIAVASELGVSLKTLSKSIRLDISKLPDDGLTLKEIKAICGELGIVRIEDLPDDWRELLKRSRTDQA